MAYHSKKLNFKWFFSEIVPKDPKKESKRFLTNFKVEGCENLDILGSPMEANARRVLLNEKRIELQRLSEVVTELDAHYGFYLLKNCFSLPKLL